MKNKLFLSSAAAVVAVSSFGTSVFAHSFIDVPSKYMKAVDFVVSKGVSGFNKKEFGTYRAIKRVDAAVMLAKVLDLDGDKAPASGFKDVPSRAVKYVNALKAAGITVGKTDTLFGSDDYVTRGEIAMWIQKGFDLKGSAEISFTDVAPQYQEAVSALVKHKITVGKNQAEFGTYEDTIRGDYAIFLYRAAQIIGSAGDGSNPEEPPVVEPNPPEVNPDLEPPVEDDSDVDPDFDVTPELIKPTLNIESDKHTPPAISTHGNGVEVLSYYNNVTVGVAFNTDVELEKVSAENPHNYKVAGKSGRTAKLLDNNLVFLTMDYETVEENSTLDIEISGVQSIEGAVMDTVSTNDYFVENVRPYVEKVEVVKRDQL